MQQLRWHPRTLSRHAHVLGEETGLIVGKNKIAWRTVLLKRYGVGSSDNLSEDQLADFTAFLNTLANPQQMAA